MRSTSQQSQRLTVRGEGVCGLRLPSSAPPCHGRGCSVSAALAAAQLVVNKVIHLPVGPVAAARALAVDHAVVVAGPQLRGLQHLNQAEDLAGPKLIGTLQADRSAGLATGGAA